MAAMYLDYGIEATPDRLDFIASIRTARLTVLEYDSARPSSGTDIDLVFFLPGIVTIAAIIVGFVVSALVSHIAMVRANRSDYALGLRVADVARFARNEKTCKGETKGELLLLKQRHDCPLLTALRLPGRNGTWTEDDAMAFEQEQCAALRRPPKALSQ